MINTKQFPIRTTFTNNEIEVVPNTSILNLFTDLNELEFEFKTYMDSTEKTLKTYSKGVKNFITYFNNLPTTQKELTRLTFLNYKHYLVSNYKVTTTNTYLNACKQFFHWLKDDKHLLKEDITRNIKNVRQEKEFLKSSISLSDSKELLNSIDTTSQEGLRDYLIISLSLAIGLRENEIAQINIEDLQLMNGITIVRLLRKGRSSKSQFLPIDSKLETQIRKYISLYRKNALPTDSLFTSLCHRTLGKRLTSKSISRMGKERLRKIGIDSPFITFHSFRHSCATITLENGATLQEVSELLGHSDINITRRYAHNIDRLTNRANSIVSNLLFE